MSQAPKPAGASDSDIALTITRRFAASPGEVYAAWTDPARVGRWIGPRGISAEAKLLDPCVGGAYEIAMRMPSGEIKTVRGIYREVRPGERLAFTWAWDAEGGKPGHETLVTLTFRALGNETEMVLRHERFADEKSRDSHNGGWGGSFDKLVEFLAAP